MVIARMLSVKFSQLMTGPEVFMLSPDIVLILGSMQQLCSSPIIGLKQGRRNLDILPFQTLSTVPMKWSQDGLTAQKVATS